MHLLFLIISLVTHFGVIQAACGGVGVHVGPHQSAQQIGR